MTGPRDRAVERTIRIAARPETVWRFWTDPERIVLVVAGGDAGRFSAVFGPCDGMKAVPVTREVRWST